MIRSRVTRAVGAGLWALALLAASARAHALTLNLTFLPSVASSFGVNTVSMTNAMTYAAQQIDSQFSNSLTLNISVAGSPGTSTLGGSLTNLTGFDTYSQVRTALVKTVTSSTSPYGSTIAANLPATNPVGGTSADYVVPLAEAYALGLQTPTTASCGTTTFGAGFNYTFDPNDRDVAGDIDFIGVAEHEMTEVMGRISSLGTNFGNGIPDYMPYDLFRFDRNTTTRDMTNGNNIWFSIDGGHTDLMAYNFPNGNGSDAQDWASGFNDSFNAFSSSSVENPFTTTDGIAMNSLGYNLNPVPEPGTLALLAAACAGWLGYRLTGSRRLRACLGCERQSARVTPSKLST